TGLELHTGWLDNGRRRGDQFIHTMTPSKFAPVDAAEPTGEEPEQDIEDAFADIPSPRTDNPATRYGLWWHGFAQRLPWGAGIEACREAFDSAVSGSPDPVRARREWTLLDQ